MSSKEIKEEIQTILENAPEPVLEDFLSYLKKLLASSDYNPDDLKNLKKILERDRNLLDRLAK
jgi:hypothetical protein